MEEVIYKNPSRRSLDVAIAAGRVGEGWLAWIGDSNATEGTRRVTSELLCLNTTWILLE